MFPKNKFSVTRINQILPPYDGRPTAGVHQTPIFSMNSNDNVIQGDQVLVNSEGHHKLLLWENKPVVTQKPQ